MTPNVPVRILQGIDKSKRRIVSAFLKVVRDGGIYIPVGLRPWDDRL